MIGLISPLTGAPLHAESESLLREPDGRLWPVIDGIPYLRMGREALVADAVSRIANGRRDEACALLLADQDDWWTGPSPRPEDLARLVRSRESLSLRAAMDLLAFGRVGDYFAHRWSDPTFLAGLALLDAHWRPAESAFELACGIGHYGRELTRRGLAYTGADVVFAKLWLARHWVLGDAATLICFDAASPWPVGEGRFDLVFCHDAFYFLEPKPEILGRLRALRAPGGRLAIGHVHNSGAANLSAGQALSSDDVARLFPEAAVYDDAELTEAFVAGRAPQPDRLAALAGVEAFAIEDAPATPVRAGLSGLTGPEAGAALRLNPLYTDTDTGPAVRWPSARYEAEYAPRATYPLHLPGGLDTLTPDAARRRILVDLPERW